VSPRGSKPDLLVPSQEQTAKLEALKQNIAKLSGESLRGVVLSLLEEKTFVSTIKLLNLLQDNVTKCLSNVSFTEETQTDKVNVEVSQDVKETQTDKPAHVKETQTEKRPEIPQLKIETFEPTPSTNIRESIEGSLALPFGVNSEELAVMSWTTEGRISLHIGENGDSNWRLVSFPEDLPLAKGNLIAVLLSYTLLGTPSITQTKTFFVITFVGLADNWYLIVK
jgi:hypothetical protein